MSDTPLSEVAAQLDAFTAYARDRLVSGSPGSIDELYEEWRSAQPRDEDRRAIEASVRDMQAGETGRPFAEFAQEFRTRNGLGGTP